MKLILGFKTRLGPVFIGMDAAGKFHPVWKGESLGPYPSLVAAVDDVAGGKTFPPSDGTDMGSLDISRDWGAWSPPSDFT